MAHISSAREKQNSSAFNLLTGSECSICGMKFFPERAVCPDDRSESIGKMIKIKGANEGEVFAHSVVYTPPEGFEGKTPYVVGIIELDNGLKAEGIIDCEPQDAKIGMKVNAGFGRITEDGPDGLIKYAYMFRPSYERKNNGPVENICYDGCESGIVAYGAFIPRFRIKTSEIARAWGKDKDTIKGLHVFEKAVAGMFDDSATMAVEAARNAIRSFDIDPKDIGAIYVGSESKPYAVKPTALIVADAIGASPVVHAADLEFACNAGMEGINICKSLVDSGRIKYGLAIGTDTAQGKPDDALEFTAASGAVAYIIGKEDPIAVIKEVSPYCTNTNDFWRRQHSIYPEHAGRFSGDPGYFKHVMGATNGLLEKVGKELTDFDYCVFHQPNGKFPREVARKLGMPKEFFEQKIEPGIVVDYLGNSYSGSSLMGLAKILDIAEPGDETLVTAYGSGAGSVSMALTHVKNARTHPSVSDQIERKTMIDYSTYLRYRNKIVK